MSRGHIDTGAVAAGRALRASPKFDEADADPKSHITFRAVGRRVGLVLLSKAPDFGTDAARGNSAGFARRPSVAAGTSARVVAEAHDGEPGPVGIDAVNGKRWAPEF